MLHLEQQQPEEALEYLRRAEQERPDDAQLQFHIGNTLLALNRHDDAADAFRRSLALRPDDVDTLNNLGNALSGCLRHDEAIACFRQALAIRPDAPPALYNLGRALLALDRLEEAAESFRAALAVAGPDIEANRLIDLYNSLSRGADPAGRYDEALAVCRSVPASIADAPAVAVERKPHAADASATTPKAGATMSAASWCRSMIRHATARRCWISIRSPASACWCFPSKGAAT